MFIYYILCFSSFLPNFLLLQTNYLQKHFAIFRLRLTDTSNKWSKTTNIVHCHIDVYHSSYSVYFCWMFLISFSFQLPQTFSTKVENEILGTKTMGRELIKGIISCNKIFYVCIRGRLFSLKKLLKGLASSIQSLILNFLSMALFRSLNSTWKSLRKPAMTG